jgi:hypothetical protein
MGGHVDSGQAVLFQEIDFVGQGHDVREFKRSRFFTPRPLELRELVYKGGEGEARFMVFSVEPCPMPSLKRSLHRKIMEVGAWVDLKTHTLNNLTISGAQLIFQEKVILEQRKIRRDSKNGFTKMDEVGNLKN